MCSAGVDVGCGSSVEGVAGLPDPDDPGAAGARLHDLDAGSGPETEFRESPPQSRLGPRADHHPTRTGLQTVERDRIRCPAFPVPDCSIVTMVSPLDVGPVGPGGHVRGPVVGSADRGNRPVEDDSPSCLLNLRSPIAKITI